MNYELAVKAILDNSLESIILISPEHKVIAYNKTIQEVLFLYFEKNIQIGNDYRDFVVPANKDLYESNFNKAIKGETITIQDQTESDAVSIWFEYCIRPVFDENSKLLGVTLTAKNIDKQKRAEIELEKLAETTNAIFENTTETIVLLDKNFKLLQFNKAAFESIKKQKNKIASIGDDFRSIINEDEKEEFIEIYLKALGGESTFTEIKTTDPSGEQLWFQVRVQPVYKQSGELLGVSIFTINITEKIAAQISLKENEAKLKEIAWNQSHIIRSPVAKILGIINIFEDFPELDEKEKQEWIDRLLVSTKELDYVIRNIVDIANTKNN